MKEVFERLGYVVYWIGSGVAGLLVLVGGAFGIASAFFISSKIGSEDAISAGLMCYGLAALSWLIGRVSKFVFVGE
jgi:hypothetical protein